MKIDKKMNLVLPIEAGWVHSMPVSYAIFEKYFMPISKTFARIYGDGLRTIAGPRVAYMVLRQIAIEDGIWEGQSGVEMGLCNEIIRLSNVILTSDKGYVTIPLYTAMVQERLSAEEVSEVLNALVFFTLISTMHKKSEAPKLLSGMTRFWGGLTTLSDVTEFRTYLQTLTTVGSTGETLPTPNEDDDSQQEEVPPSPDPVSAIPIVTNPEVQKVPVASLGKTSSVPS